MGGWGVQSRLVVSLLTAAHPELCVCATLARERTMGLSMMPRRKSRSMSLAPVEVGSSPRLSNTCCMAGWTGSETQAETEKERNKVS